MHSSSFAVLIVILAATVSIQLSNARASSYAHAGRRDFDSEKEDNRLMKLVLRKLAEDQEESEERFENREKNEESFENREENEERFDDREESEERFEEVRDQLPRTTGDAAKFLKAYLLDIARRASTYTVASGDTFWSIAQKTGTTVQALMSANPGVAPERLQIGQVLRLPGGGSGTPSSNQGALKPTGKPPPNGRESTTLNQKVPRWCEQLRGMINSAAQKANVPADLIAAVIYQESGGNIHVVSTGNPNGGSDSGLMQVNQFTAAEIRRKYPSRFAGLQGTAENIMLGASYLRDLYDSSANRDWGITLRAYNSGPNGVDKNNLRARPAGTGDSTYVDKVYRIWTDISTGRDPPADHYASIFGKGF